MISLSAADSQKAVPLLVSRKQDFMCVGEVHPSFCRFPDRTISLWDLSLRKVIHLREPYTGAAILARDDRGVETGRKCRDNR